MATAPPDTPELPDLDEILEHPEQLVNPIQREQSKSPKNTVACHTKAGARKKCKLAGFYHRILSSKCSTLSSS